ncbi:hypothetical protein C8A03DRAFT_40451 [Achaetomium macrosporum]|uniref:Reverse transcriptase n=1 Tax=Achaetomium macrosporum TaxID=79813 RepID=A0AAN7HA24_9PEZI|nr:hypothetical protein C8A03DRAFT_40451 [Achaetomium macrosporum]
MATPTSVLSKTLQSITLSKIRELESRHQSYEARKPRPSRCLLEAVRELQPAAPRAAGLDNPNLNNIQRWLDHFSRQLRARLDIHSRKLDMAHLYSRLLTEWMDQPLVEPLPTSDDPDNDSFELVERQRQRLSELVDKFESVVFQPLETDETEIRRFLDSLFPDEESQKELAKLRKRIADESADFMSEAAPFIEQSVTNCIKGLLTEDIVSDEKQAILREFLESDIAKSEIADVLNMRSSDLKQWQWNAGKDGIRVMPRRGLNGKYRFWADDDILQMIFVRYIGIRLCNLLNPAVKAFMAVVLRRDLEAPSDTDRQRRQFYLNKENHYIHGVEKQRTSDYFEKFILAQLPATESSLFNGDVMYDDDDDSGLAKGQSSIKQQLLRHLATELIVHRLRALVQTDLQWYGTGLSHSTVFAVMRYVGFGQDWIDFFNKYLESPLNLDAASDNRPQLGPRVRKRGVPMAHASEKFTGELVLFFMDLAVNRKTGLLLYRLHDDIWLVGEPQRTAQAWDCMQSFAKVFGLAFNKAETGSVYIPGSGKRDATITQTLPAGPVKIGFLCLDPLSGKWVIDQKLVVAHVDQLKKQVSESNSVLSWVQTWNSCVGRFFSHTFGEPAYCFGREHVDEVLNTYRDMVRRLFPGSNGEDGSVVEHLKRMIQDRFGVSGLPDSFIYLPEQLGGLGLRNPFVGMFLVRDNITQSPEDIVEEYLKDERDNYRTSKKNFDGLGEEALQRRLRKADPEKRLAKHGFSETEMMESFFSLNEYSRFRERYCARFFTAFQKLVTVPETEEVVLSSKVIGGLRGVRLDFEKWFLQRYAQELIEEFGGLSLVDKQFLPVGVLTMMRAKKISWNMVL